METVFNAFLKIGHYSDEIPKFNFKSENQLLVPKKNDLCSFVLFTLFNLNDERKEKSDF